MSVGRSLKSLEDETRNVEKGEVAEERKKTRRDFKEAFLLFDKNGDGSISAEELGEFMRGLGKEMSEAALDKMIRNIDADGNGQIEYQEFVEMLNKEDDDSALMESFRVFDKNGDGFISIHELKQVIASLGEVASEEELQEMLKEADADGDGKVDFDEFVKMLTATPK